MHSKAIKISLFTLFLFFQLLFPLTAEAQNPGETWVLVLNSGDKISGVITGKTDETLSIQTADGKRFQFLRSDIMALKPEEKVDVSTEEKNVRQSGSFVAKIELDGGLAHSSRAGITGRPVLGASLALGSSGALGESSFLGGGLGFESIPHSERGRTITFLPIYAQALLPLTKSKNKPYAGGKSGYNIPLSGRYSGGLFFEVSGGFMRQLSYKSTAAIGLYLKTEQISGIVVEINELGEFITEGKSNVNSLGISLWMTF